MLVIAIPALLNSIPAPRWRPAALAVWGGFVPLGYAVGDFLARAVDAPANPQHFLLLAILLFAAMATPAALLLLRVGDSDALLQPHSGVRRFRATMSLPVLLVSLAFGIYVILSLGFFAFLPKFLQSAGSAVWLSAGAISLTVPLGNLLASLLVRGNARAILLLAVLDFTASALVAVPAFDVVEGVSPTVALVTFAVAGGVIASALFAVIPAIVPRDGSAAVAIGFVCQAGGIGTSSALRSLPMSSRPMAGRRRLVHDRCFSCRHRQSATAPLGRALAVAPCGLMAGYIRQCFSGERSEGQYGQCSDRQELRTERRHRRPSLTNAAAWSPACPPALFLKRHEPIDQRIELLLESVDDFPLLRDLPGQFLDGPFLFGGADLQCGDVIGRRDHVELRFDPAQKAVGSPALTTFEIDKHALICRE